MRPCPELDLEKITFYVSCIDHDRASFLVSGLLENMARLVGSEPHLETGSVESVFGWTLYTLSIIKDVVKRFAVLPESDMLKSWRETLDQKFATWFNRQFKLRMQQVEVRLLSDLISPKFGFF